MIPPKEHHNERQYRPLAAKTLRHALIHFIIQEFPRLGGPWIVERFVDKLLEMVDTHSVSRKRLQPGEMLWLAVAVDECPGYRKPMSQTRHVPVVLTLASQEDIAALRTAENRRAIRNRIIIRVANEAYEQGGVLTCTELGLLFHLSASRVAAIIREHEAASGEIVPRRGNVHDMGRTISHKAIICRKAFLEGKPTHIVARETFHSPTAVDHYILDFSRVHFATIQRGMSPEEAAFAIQRPVGLVRQYVKLIEEFDLDSQQVYDRACIQLLTCNDGAEQPLASVATQVERREQEPMAG